MTVANAIMTQTTDIGAQQRPRGAGPASVRADDLVAAAGPVGFGALLDLAAQPTRDTTAQSTLTRPVAPAGATHQAERHASRPRPSGEAVAASDTATDVTTTPAAGEEASSSAAADPQQPVAAEGSGAHAPQGRADDGEKTTASADASGDDVAVAAGMAPLPSPATVPTPPGTGSSTGSSTQDATTASVGAQSRDQAASRVTAQPDVEGDGAASGETATSPDIAQASLMQTGALQAGVQQTGLVQKDGASQLQAQITGAKSGAGGARATASLSSLAGGTGTAPSAEGDTLTDAASSQITDLATGLAAAAGGEMSGGSGNGTGDQAGDHSGDHSGAAGGDSAISGSSSAPAVPADPGAAVPADPDASLLAGAAAAATGVASTAAGMSGGVTAPARTVTALAAQIVQNVENKVTRFDVALDPEGLGRVNVSVQIGARGELSARLLFEHPEAATALAGQSLALRQSLLDAGFTLKPEDLTFQTGMQDAGAGGAGGGFGTSGGEQRPSPGGASAFHAMNRLADLTDLSAMGAATGGVLRGLDIRI